MERERVRERVFLFYKYKKKNLREQEQKKVSFDGGKAQGWRGRGKKKPYISLYFNFFLVFNRGMMYTFYLILKQD